jgi:hypothetical protein
MKRALSTATVVATVALLMMAVTSSAAASKHSSKHSSDDKKISFGVQASWGDDADLGLGARVQLDLENVKPGLAAVGSFDYFFPGNGGVTGVDISYWEANANVTYSFELKGRPFRPYVGTGLNLAHGSGSVDILGISAGGSDNNIGANLLGGVAFSKGNLKPFVEAKFELGGGKQFVLSGGVRF